MIIIDPTYIPEFVFVLFFFFFYLKQNFIIFILANSWYTILYVTPNFTPHYTKKKKN